MHYILIRQVLHLILLVYWVWVSFLVKKIHFLHIYHVQCARVMLPVELCWHDLDMKAEDVKPALSHLCSVGYLPTTL